MSGVLLVTGGSRGIGAAVALQAARQGWNVAVNYQGNKARAEAVVEEIKAGGGVAFAVQGDVALEADVQTIFTAVDREFGPVTGLVNNAGITGPVSRLDSLSPEALRRLVDINIIGSVACAREAIKRMSTNHGGEGGAIVNLSSIAAVIGGAGEWVSYAMTKGAIDSFTLGLAREVAAEGIRVNAVAPGLIETEIHAAAGVGDRLEKLAPMIPMKRTGTAEEVAESIMWLLSPASSYVTGAILKVTGGR
jgi:NAD(P)-dependent dehydrogenase (short-subunit alcohol dehydrogenase family)